MVKALNVVRQVCLGATLALLSTFTFMPMTSALPVLQPGSPPGTTVHQPAAPEGNLAPAEVNFPVRIHGSLLIWQVVARAVPPISAY